mgnify:CR=1 FL=1|tara:strand:+ start:406 stop:630 length:225 start_codon:yes stop_codon:yes gene_type:complete
MKIMTNKDIHNRASDKAFAKMSMLTFEITDNKTSLITGNYGGDITEEEMRMILNGNKIELKVWSYIAKLIETNE